MKLPHLFAVTTLLLANTSAGFASTISPSEFAKEQAMDPTQRIGRWAPLIREASRRFGIAEEWIRAVMKMETGGRTLAGDATPIASSKGAMGIMQVMPDTYRDMRVQYGLGANPYDPHDNVMAGAAYLKWLYGKYGYPKLFAAYNAGPGTVDNGSLPAETRAYVGGIARFLGDMRAAPADPAPVVKKIALTRPDGTTISVDATTVDKVRAPLTDEYAPGVQTVVSMGTRHQGVLEAPNIVASLIKSHGGKV